MAKSKEVKKKKLTRGEKRELFMSQLLQLVQEDQERLYRQSYRYQVINREGCQTIFKKNILSIVNLHFCPNF